MRTAGGHGDCRTDAIGRGIRVSGKGRERRRAAVERKTLEPAKRFLIPVTLTATPVRCRRSRRRAAAATPTAQLQASAVADPVDLRPSGESLPVAVEYDLGEAILVQESFPEDSRFRNMPVRLNGLIAVPSGEGRPYPVVVILHGNHHGCPVDEQGVDRWPCASEVEQPNYRGFSTWCATWQARLCRLSININAENTFGFGEPVPGERWSSCRICTARAVGGAAKTLELGVELAGRADLGRLAWSSPRAAAMRLWSWPISRRWLPVLPRTAATGRPRAAVDRRGGRLGRSARGSPVPMRSYCPPAMAMWWTRADSISTEGHGWRRSRARGRRRPGWKGPTQLL
jgi:hypothetical protein